MGTAQPTFNSGYAKIKQAPSERQGIRSPETNQVHCKRRGAKPLSRWMNGGLWRRHFEPRMTAILAFAAERLWSWNDPDGDRILIEALKQARRYDGLSQRTLAARIGIDVQKVRRLESGVGAVLTLLEIMSALDSAAAEWAAISAPFL
jgi:DNA-binding XRE family transcriptional regulator